MTSQWICFWKLPAGCWLTSRVLISWSSGLLLHQASNCLYHCNYVGLCWMPFKNTFASFPCCFPSCNLSIFRPISSYLHGMFHLFHLCASGAWNYVQHSLFLKRQSKEERKKEIIGVLSLVYKQTWKTSMAWLWWSHNWTAANPALIPSSWTHSFMIFIQNFAANNIWVMAKF